MDSRSCAPEGLLAPLIGEFNNLKKGAMSPLRPIEPGPGTRGVYDRSPGTKPIRYAGFCRSARGIGLPKAGLALWVQN